MLRLVFTLILSLTWTYSYTNNTDIVDAYYKYIIPENTTQAEAKATAMERAITVALANKYGTLVNAETWTEIRNNNGESRADTWRIGSSAVKGEWLETISGPEYKLITDGNNLAIEVRLKGRAAPLSERTIDLHFEILRVGNDGVFESQRFKSGDKLEFKFGSPVNGSLLLFIDDGEGTVSQLLPFANQKEGAMPISAGKRYHFFNDNSAPNAEQYQLLTDNEVERNTLYVIFTPNHIVKPMSDENNNIKFMSIASFRSWLSQQRAIDKDLQIRPIPISITN